MALSEGIAATVAYKFSASGTINPTEPVAATDPGATGAQYLRRTSVALNLVRSSFQSNEMRPDRQVGDMRLGMKKVEGSLSGELSPATYMDLMVAAHRDTAAAAVSNLTNTTFTSVTFDNTTSTITFAGSDPVVTGGLRVGDIVRITAGITGANLNQNFVVTGFSNASNRTMAVFPAPTTQAAQTTFTMTRPGKSTFVPSTGHVARKCAIEVNHNDATDYSRLFTECRITGYKLSLPAEGMSTVEFSVTGRGFQSLTGAAAPFFSNPTAVTSTGVCAAANGLLRVAGATVGTVTGLDIDFSMTPDAPAVVGSTVTPDITLGPAVVTGTLQAYLDPTMIAAFSAETEFDILVELAADGLANGAAIVIHMPRCKLTSANVDVSGNGGTTMSLPFVALRYAGSAPGVVQTTIRVLDTEAP